MLLGARKSSQKSKLNIFIVSILFCPRGYFSDTRTFTADMTIMEGELSDHPCLLVADGFIRRVERNRGLLPARPLALHLL